MPGKESPLSKLGTFLPEGSLELVLEYLKTYKVHLTVTRERITIMGNYRNRHFDKNHRISVNGSLNRYSFLITLLHELGHLLTFEKYGNRIPPHGAHWKQEYGRILEEFIAKKIFPHDIELVLLHSLKTPAASSCAEPHLTRVLRKYDAGTVKLHFVEELPVGASFMIKGGRVFKKGEKIRTRYKCVEVCNGKVFLFSGVYEVKQVSRSLGQ